MKKFSGEWKPIDIEGNFTPEDLEGLIGISELTDYDLSALPNRKSDTPERKGAKRKKLKDTIRNPSVNNEPGAYVRSPNFKARAKQIETEKDESVDLKGWSFVPLQHQLLRALADLGFEKPTPIQELSLPSAILGRRDILGAAETGSGKTLAFGLPILSGILHLKAKTDGSKSFEKMEVDEDSDSDDDVQTNKPLYALVLTPTRELAVQVKNHLASAAKYTDIRVAVIVGGMSPEKQERILRKGPEIVVATPGRLWELIQGKNSHLTQIDSIKYLAIDETDRMLEKGHFQELHELLERLNENETRRKDRQNFMFSATLTLVHDLPRHLMVKKKIKARFSNKILKMTPGQKLQKIISMLGVSNPKVVDVTQKNGMASSLTECRINCEIDEKDYYLYYFLQRHPGRTLIFCNSIGCVKRLATLLSLLGCSPLPLHASMQQRQRLKNLERFRDNPLGVLVATDVAARGLDIPQVDHVLHYQTPRTGESYVHRSGRTARASRIGITVLLIEPTEINTYLQVCSTLGREQDLPTFPVAENYLNAVKTRVNLARDLDKLELHLKRNNAEVGWLQKAAEDMDIIIDDLDSNISKDSEHFAKLKNQAALKRKELQALLSKPIFQKGFSGKYPTSLDGASMPLVQGQPDLPEKAVNVLKMALDRSANKVTKKKPQNRNRNRKKMLKIKEQAKE